MFCCAEVYRREMNKELEVKKSMRESMQNLAKVLRQQRQV